MERPLAEVVVVGAGPAGLAAALSARQVGASVTLLDSADALGGQYWRHLPNSRPARRESRLHHGWSTFVALRRQLELDVGCRVLTSAQVWAIEPGSPRSVTIHVLIGPPDSVGRTRLSLSPDAVVLATGAHDRTLPFPGWDLPGVFTAGAAQALAKGERVAVGNRVLVAGAGPFLLPVAAALAQTGSKVVGVLEANRVSTLVKGWSQRPWELVSAAGKGAELVGYLINHLKNRIPYYTGRAVVEAHGTDRVTAVTTAAVDARWTPIAGTERTTEVDSVAVSHGFTPRLELAIAAGCSLSNERFVHITNDQQTGVRGVFAAGEITGIGGVDLALAEGRIAGHVAAGGDFEDPAIAGAVARRRTFRGFAARIEAAHGVRPGWTGWLAQDTVVCRCEEVTFRGLCLAADGTATTSLRSLKLSSRAGLGICQGRVCGRSVEDILASRGPNGGLVDGVLTDHRPIASPVRMADLAAGAETSYQCGDLTPTCQSIPNEMRIE